jgi:hypothetical protein
MSDCAHYSAFASRLILAQLTGDEHATEVIITEVGNCPHCWEIVAELLAELAALYMEDSFGLDKAIRYTEGDIACNLDMLARRWGES